VDRIGIDRFGEIGANGAGCGLFRIRGPHEVAIFRDRVVALEDLDHDRTRRHEIDQVLEKRAFAVNGIKTAGFRQR
jgi:hypothetical protein